jgi:Tfp pilus assembly protein PilF
MHFPKEFSEFLNAVWMETGAAQNYFEVAVEANPLDPKLLCEYAPFSWKLQHNADKAEDLYKQALEAAPDDADIIASYALFLWQSDS